MRGKASAASAAGGGDADDAATLFRRAVAENVRAVTIVGVDLATSVRARDIAAQLHAVAVELHAAGEGGSSGSASHHSEHGPARACWSAGLHPHSAARCREEWRELRRLIDDAVRAPLSAGGRCSAIGETGLDYFKSSADAVRHQKQAMSLHLDACDELRLPVIIHCRDSSATARDAHDDLFELLEARRGRHPPLRGVVHCFSSDAHSMRRAVALGLKVSFCCTLAYPNNHALRDACTHCPLEAMLIETDSPYLPPADMRGRRNEPAFVHRALDAVVACKLEVGEFRGEGADNVRHHIAERLWRNSVDLYGCGQ